MTRTMGVQILMSAPSREFADQVPYVRTLRAVIAATVPPGSMGMHARLRDASILTNVHDHHAEGTHYVGTTSGAFDANVPTVFKAIR